MPEYRRLYARGAYVPADYRVWLAARVAPLLRRHGLGSGEPKDVRIGDGAFPDGAMPQQPVEVVAAPVNGPDQLTLL